MLSGLNRLARRIRIGMDEQSTTRNTADFTGITDRLVQSTEMDLSASGADPHSWAYIVATATLTVAGASPDVFYVDAEGRDHALSLGFDADLFAIASSFDSTAVAALVHVRNTLGQPEEYAVLTELGYRSETGVQEFVDAPYGRPNAAL